MQRTNRDQRDPSTYKSLRLDEQLLLLHLASSRSKAQDLIRAGVVMVNGAIEHRPGARVPANSIVLCLQAEDPWVSRGAWKLLSALDRFAVDPSGRTCFDLGSSTGGFTQVLLVRGATRVIALDVGTNQLSPILRTDHRVDVREGTHILELSPDTFPRDITVTVIDLSFISLTKVFPKLAGLLAKGTDVIALVKPQFEVGRDAIKKGVVRDAKLREGALHSVLEVARRAGFVVLGTMDSPIEGGEGNHEYLVHLIRTVR